MRKYSHIILLFITLIITAVKNTTAQDITIDLSIR